VNLVAVIDDDASVRRALARRLRTAGHDVETFESAQDYLARSNGMPVGCIVTDLRMPGMSGLELQSSLAGAGRDVPMIFVSGHGDVPASVRAMRAGAVHFLGKPVSEEEILGAVAEALAVAAQRREMHALTAEARRAFETLTPRERQVFDLVVEGLPNKLIADRIGAAEKTVKIHRGRVMSKMGARSVADLVRMASRLRPP
jgi:FixJ family two-component response regulator